MACTSPNSKAVFVLIFSHKLGLDSASAQNCLTSSKHDRGTNVLHRERAGTGWLKSRRLITNSAHRSPGAGTHAGGVHSWLINSLAPHDRRIDVPKLGINYLKKWWHRLLFFFYIYSFQLECFAVISFLIIHAFFLFYLLEVSVHGVSEPALAMKHGGWCVLLTQDSTSYFVEEKKKTQNVGQTIKLEADEYM